MKMIIADSSCDITELNREYKNISYKRVPLSIMIEGNNYIDTAELNIDLMMQHMETYKGKTSSACPSPDAWAEAARDADEIFMIPLSSSLSGSYNSALIAQNMINEEYPDKKVYIVDSLAASGENILLVYKLAELLESGMDFLDVCVKIEDYKSKVKLNFVLFSINNLVKNGRVSKLIGVASNALNMSFVGEASEEGTFKLLHKGRGLAKSIGLMIDDMKKTGYKGGKVIISHALNELGAIKLKENILKNFPNANISIVKCSGLCSYYAERNGFLVGYEI